MKPTDTQTTIAVMPDNPGAALRRYTNGPPVTDTQNEIKKVCDELCELLLSKNRAYGDSAISPLRIFSKADSVEQINVRIDDKLSRIARGTASGEDVEWDLMGYLVLKRVAERLKEKQ